MLLLCVLAWSRSGQLEAGQFEEKPFWGCDLGSEHEKYLTKIFNSPV